MPRDSVSIEINENSNNSIDVESGDVKNLFTNCWCKIKYLAFIFLLAFPLFVFLLEAFLYPWPPQIDAYAFCEIDGLLPRRDYQMIKLEIREIGEKLAIFKTELLSPIISYDTYLGYKTAKNMLEEQKFDLESIIQKQQSLWQECITKNIDSTLILIEPKLQTFVHRIITLTIISFFISFLIFGITKIEFTKDSLLLFNISFIFQTFLFVSFLIVWFLASIFYSQLWNLSSDKFLLNL